MIYRLLCRNQDSKLIKIIFKKIFKKIFFYSLVTSINLSQKSYKKKLNDLKF